MPAAKVALHLPGQVMPDGWLETEPGPTTLTASTGVVAATAVAGSEPTAKAASVTAANMRAREAKGLETAHMRRFEARNG